MSPSLLFFHEVNKDNVSAIAAKFVPVSGSMPSYVWAALPNYFTERFDLLRPPEDRPLGHFDLK